MDRGLGEAHPDLQNGSVLSNERSTAAFWYQHFESVACPVCCCVQKHYICSLSLFAAAQAQI